MKNVTLLVCLSPSIMPELVSEMSFFGIVNSITPVRNLKMVCSEGQLKAFVQVKDEIAAASVINEVHGKTVDIGKLKVYVSHKKYVNYEKTLADILKQAAQNTPAENNSETASKPEKEDNSAATSCNLRRNSGSGLSGSFGPRGSEDVKFTNSIFSREFKTSGAGREFLATSNGTQAKQSTLNKFSKTENSTQSNEEDASAKMRISITNDDPLELKSKKISEIFGQFGTIVKKIYDSANLIWTLVYDTEESAVIAAAHVKSAMVAEYRLATPAEKTSPVRKLDPDQNKADARSGPLFNNAPLRRCPVPDSNSMSSSSLKIYDSSQSVSIETVCRLVARVHVPVQVLEARNVNGSKVFHIVKFTNQEEAANVQNFLNSHAHALPQVEITFA